MSLNNAGVLIVSFDYQGLIQRVNPVCEALIGYPEAQLLGHAPWEFLLVPQERAVSMNLFAQIRAGQPHAYAIETWVGKLGRQHKIAWSFTALGNPEKHVGQIIAAGNEVCLPDRALEPEGIEAERLLERIGALMVENQQLRKEMRDRRKTELVMRRSEKQLRLVTNALPALVAYIDPSHRYRFNNYAYESWYNIPYQQIKGRQVIDIVSPGVYREMLPYLEQALAGESATYEAELVKSSGHRIWASITYIPDIQEGKVQGLFSLISDISDRKAAEHLKDEFVSVVSHELRTPLTSVHGSLKLIATGQLGSLNEQGRELIEIALNNTERLTRLINDVLDLERMGSGRVSLNPRHCLASELVESAAKAMQAMADDFDIHLVVEAQPDPVWADPDYIMQALTNLISNAVKFSPRGGTVWVGVRRDNAAESAIGARKVKFFVKDNGRGIPSDKLETIFERFQQVDTSDARERGGTGLGLAICREIVQQHQGRIWVKSIHGQGSAFYFTLPQPLEEQSPGQAVQYTQAPVSVDVGAGVGVDGVGTGVGVDVDVDLEANAGADADADADIDTSRKTDSATNCSTYYPTGFG